MDRLFIPVFADYDLKRLDMKKLSKILPKRLGLIGSIQYVEAIPAVKKFLEGKGYEIEIGGQILGCNVSVAKPIQKDVDAFLYVGDGLFHPKALEKLQKDCYLEDGRILKWKTHKVNMTKFYHATEIGIIVSLKPGQMYPLFENLKDNLKEKFPDKNFYVFICDTLDYSQMNNFGFIKVWINTACPRIQDDLPVINAEDLHGIIDPKLSASSVHSDAW